MKGRQPKVNWHIGGLDTTYLDPPKEVKTLESDEGRCNGSKEYRLETTIAKEHYSEKYLGN